VVLLLDLEFDSHKSQLCCSCGVSMAPPSDELLDEVSIFPAFGQDNIYLPTCNTLGSC
jgi:hypothetical protein